MRVEGGGLSEFVFVLGQLASEGGTFFGPFAIAGIENLGHRAPADVPDENCLFLDSRGSRFRFHTSKCLDGSEILLEFLLRSAFTKTVGLSDSVVVEILRWLGGRRPYPSGGSRMYFSRNISHA